MSAEYGWIYLTNNTSQMTLINLYVYISLFSAVKMLAYTEQADDGYLRPSNYNLAPNNEKKYTRGEYAMYNYCYQPT